MGDETPWRDDCPACVVRRFWEEDLGFCGCGIQGPTLGIFRDVLQSLAEWSADIEKGGDGRCCWDRLRGIFGDNTAWEYLVYYVLAKHDVTEHGGSVPGWLSDYGQRILAAMAGKTDDELDEMLNHEPFDHEAFP